MKTFLLIFPLFLLAGCKLDRITLEEPVRDQSVEICTEGRVTVCLNEFAAKGECWKAKCSDPFVRIRIEHEPPDRSDGSPGLANVRIHVLRGFTGPSPVYMRCENDWSGECTRTVKILLHGRPTDVAIWK